METLTKKEFKSLTKTEQVIKLFGEGEEILTREEEGYHIHLYTLSNIFVELWYQSNTKKIIKVEITNPESIIIKYNDIGLSELV